MQWILIELKNNPRRCAVIADRAAQNNRGAWVGYLGSPLGIYRSSRSRHAEPGSRDTPPDAGECLIPHALKDVDE